MTCDPKYLPQGPITVEISARCFQRRFLLRPDDATNDRLRGIVAYTTAAHPDVDLHVITFQSNHYHALLTAPDEAALVRFVELLQSRIAYEMNRLRGRTGAFWSGPFKGIPVAASQLEARLRYLLAQGIANGLYLKPAHNPCVHSLPWLLDGVPLTGGWIDRTAFHRAGGFAAGHRPEDFVRQLTARLTPPPGWEAMTEPQRQARWRALVREATTEALERRARRGHGGRKVLGADRMRATDPFSRPPDPPEKKAPPPAVFGDPKEEAHFMEEAAAVRVQRREALERVADEWPGFGFPRGMYPPSALAPLLRRRE